MNRIFLFAVLGIALLCITILLKLENDSRIKSNAAIAAAKGHLSQATPTASNRASNNKAPTALPRNHATPQFPEKITLWEKPLTEASQDGIRVYETQVDPDLLTRFQVGQTLDFSLPDDTTPLYATLENTHNQGRFAKVWTAEMAELHETQLTIIQGKIETHLTIMHKGAVYSAIIDNHTGRTVVVDQADLTDQTIPYEDGVALPVAETPLPRI